MLEPPTMKILFFGQFLGDDGKNSQIIPWHFSTCPLHLLTFAANETLHPLGEHHNIGSATKLSQLPKAPPKCMCKLKLEKTSSNLRSNFKEIWIADSKNTVLLLPQCGSTTCSPSHFSTLWCFRPYKLVCPIHTVLTVWILCGSSRPTKPTGQPDLQGSQSPPDPLDPPDPWGPPSRTMGHTSLYGLKTWSTWVVDKLNRYMGHIMWLTLPWTVILISKTHLTDFLVSTFVSIFVSWFVQGDNVLFSIPLVNVEEGGEGAEEAPHNRSDHCNRLQGGECYPHCFAHY